MTSKKLGQGQRAQLFFLSESCSSLESRKGNLTRVDGKRLS